MESYVLLMIWCLNVKCATITVTIIHDWQHDNHFVILSLHNDYFWILHGLFDNKTTAHKNHLMIMAIVTVLLFWEFNSIRSWNREDEDWAKLWSIIPFLLFQHHLISYSFFLFRLHFELQFRSRERERFREKLNECSFKTLVDDDDG